MSELFKRNIYTNIQFAIDKKYQAIGVLGKGTYGVVCEATEIGLSNSHPIAIKKVQKIFSNEILVKRAFRELRLMRHFRGHKNIVSLLDLDMITTKPYDGLYCYQELMDHDLTRVINGPVQISEIHVQSFTYQLLCGVKYIHSANIVHRDLKPGNLLVNALGQLKICDFGLARGIQSKPAQGNGRVRYTRYVATRWYRAPELIIQIDDYTQAVDLWSVGCILCELIGRKAIFKGQNQEDQIVQIVRVLGLPKKELIIELSNEDVWSVFKDCHARTNHTPLTMLYPEASPSAIDLIKKLLDYDRKARFTAIQALDHEFLSEFHNPDEEPVCDETVDFSFESLRNKDLTNALAEEIKSFRAEVRGGPKYKRHYTEYTHTGNRIRKYSASRFLS